MPSPLCPGTCHGPSWPFLISPDTFQSPRPAEGAGPTTFPRADRPNGREATSTRVAPPPAGPVVGLQVNLGGRPTLFEVGDGGFLIGSVPGCDLRLPGTSLAPVICLIARGPLGASLRKLAPVQPLSVNGKTVSSTYLNDGDRLSVAGVELTVSVRRDNHTGSRDDLASRPG